VQRDTDTVLNYAAVEGGGAVVWCCVLLCIVVCYCVLLCRPYYFV